MERSDWIAIAALIIPTVLSIVNMIWIGYEKYKNKSNVKLDKDLKEEKLKYYRTINKDIENRDVKANKSIASEVMSNPSANNVLRKTLDDLKTEPEIPS